MSCENRNDINFTYEWNKTNFNLNLLSSDPTYMLNYGDTLSLTLNKDIVSTKPTKIVVKSDKNGELELSSEDGITYSGVIPTSWTKEDDFQVIMTWGKKYLLWQGMLNYTTSLVDDNSYYWNVAMVKLSQKDDGKYHLVATKSANGIELNWEEIE